MTEENEEVDPPAKRRLRQVRFGRFSAIKIVLVCSAYH